MKNPYPTKPGFGLRVALARKMLIGLARGDDERKDHKTGEYYSLAHSRSMDNCFENDDAPAVVWALMQQAAKEREAAGFSTLGEGITIFLGNARAVAEWEQIHKGPTGPTGATSGGLQPTLF